MSRNHAGISLVLGFLLLGSWAGPTLARQSGTGDIPSSECYDVRPVGFLALLDLVDDLDEQSQNVQYVGYPSAEVSLEGIAQESSISPDDLLGITQTVRTLVACVNQEDPLRLFALFTESFQAGIAIELIGGSNRMETLLEEIPVFASQVDVGQQLEMFAIGPAWYVNPPGKSVAAVVSPTIPGLTEQRSYFVQFAFEKDMWLIDGISLVAIP